jgi:signal transduction histidine kinase
MASHLCYTATMLSTQALAPQADEPAPAPPSALAGTFAVALAIIEVAFDWGTWIQLNVAVLFSLPLVFAAAGRRRRLLWGLAVALVAVTFVVYVRQVPAAPAATHQSFLIDRALAAISILLGAVILDAWLRSLRVRDQQAEAIAHQYRRLESANAELEQHREEISRQNEELERHRSEIEAISKRKTQMMASIAHDIRSPIQAITLLAEVIRRTAERDGTPGRLAPLAQRLQASAIGVGDFLSEVIDAGAFDSGQIIINNSEFDLAQLLALQRDRMLPLAESKGLALVIEPCDLRLHTDRVKLSRVVGNLVGNAIKFTATGSVTLGCGLASGHQPYIRVTDTGRGMKPQDLERIFGEFAQLDAQAPQPASGSGWGLGLAIAQRMVRLLGGTIEVRSEVDHGSVFTVLLPPSCLALSDTSAINRLLAP